MFTPGAIPAPGPSCGFVLEILQTAWGFTSALLHVVALAGVALAIYFARARRIPEIVRRQLVEFRTELNAIAADAAVWKTSAGRMAEEVEAAIANLESKRRSVAATESRLKERQEPADSEPDEEPDRATLRAMRRRGA